MSNPQAGLSSPTGDWETHYDDDDTGANWYYNKKTGLSTWVKPGTYEKWVEFYDDKVGSKYYYNTLTGEAVWENPNTDAEEIDFKLDEAKPLSPADKLEVAQVALETYKRDFSKISNELIACKNDCDGKYCYKQANVKSPDTISPNKPPTPKPPPLPQSNGNFMAPVPMEPLKLPSIKEQVKHKMTSEQIELLMNKSIKPKLPPIKRGGGARTRKKRRAVVKRTKSRRKFSKRTKSRRKFNNRTKNKK